MGSNLGQAVFNIAGLVVSYYAGPLAGALVSAAGQALFPSGANVKGPRAQDQGFTTSQVGLDIPLILGTQKCAGNVIWAGPLVEHKKTQSAKGGGPKATTYTSTRSFSILVCEGPIAGIRRIWRNGKIIYDRRPKGDDESDANYRERDAANTKIEQSLRIYLGTETQLPDPLQEADKGIGKVPAYRGLAYITFEDHDITDMGGRVPNFEFEIVQKGEAFSDSDPEYRQEVLAPWVQDHDPRACENDHVYYAYVPNGSGGLDVSGPYDNTEDALAAGGADAGKSYELVGWSLTTNSASSNDLPTSGYDPGEQLQLYMLYASVAPQVDYMYHGFTCAPTGSVPRYTTFVMSADSLGPQIAYITNYLDSEGHFPETPSIPYDHGIITCGTSAIIWGIERMIRIGVQRLPKMPGTLCNPLCGEAKPLLPEDPRFCVLDSGQLSYAGSLQKSDSSTNWKILVDPLPYEAPDGSLVHLPAIPEWDDRYSDQEFWEAAAAAAIARGINIPTGPIYPEPLYGVNYPVMKTGPIWKVLQKYSYSMGGVSVVTKYPLGPAIPNFDSRYNSQEFWENAYSQAQIAEGTDWPHGIPDDLVYGSDYPVTQTYAYARVPPDIRAIYADPITIADAVTAICERCGLSAAQLNVGDLTETLVGIRVTSNTSGRTVIEQLQAYGYFDAAEIDGMLQFPLRGRDSITQLGEDDLGAHAPDEDTPPLVTLERTEPAELPRTIFIAFDDVDNEYQAGSSSPATWLTDDAASTQTITLAIAMDSRKATQIADVAISETWWGREMVSMAIMPQWLALAAGDAVDVPLEGRLERMRLVSTEMPLPAGVISAKGIRSDASIYSSYRIGAPPVLPPQRPGLVGPTSVVVLDIPALRDADNDGGFYVAVKGALSGWSGCAIQISTDNQATWIDVGTVTRPAIIGTAVNALGIPEVGTNGFDDTNTLTVSLLSTDEMQSVTDEQIAGNANPFALAAAGYWELLQFGEHVDNGDGTRTLSHLKRAQRGTATTAEWHAAGDIFVFLGDGILRVPLDATFIAQTIYLRAISIGQSEGSAEIFEIIPTGASWRGDIIDGGDLDGGDLDG